MTATEATPTRAAARRASKPASEIRAVAPAKLLGVSVRMPVRIQNRASVTWSRGTAKKLLVDAVGEIVCGDRLEALCRLSR
jgi:hypothetical protein